MKRVEGHRGHVEWANCNIYRQILGHIINKNVDKLEANISVKRKQTVYLPFCLQPKEPKMEKMDCCLVKINKEINERIKGPVGYYNCFFQNENKHNNWFKRY